MGPFREKTFAGDPPGQSIVISTVQGDPLIPDTVTAMSSLSSTSTAMLPDQVFPSGRRGTRCSCRLINGVIPLEIVHLKVCCRMMVLLNRSENALRDQHGSGSLATLGLGKCT